MKVILLADVYKHGVAGEVIDVADGFARNWLLPKNLAQKATPGALRQAEKLSAQADARKAALDHRLNELARQIDGVELFFGRRASPTGKLFGSVTTSEIAEALNEATGIDINRRRISQTALREIGTHDVPVRLGNETSPMLKVTVVREEEFKSYMAQRAAAAAAAEASAEAGEPVEGEASAEAPAGTSDEAQAQSTAEQVGAAVAAAAETVSDAVSDVAETVAEAASNAVETVQEAVAGDSTDGDEEEPEHPAE